MSRAAVGMTLKTLLTGPYANDPRDQKYDLLKKEWGLVKVLILLCFWFLVLANSRLLCDHVPIRCR